MMISYAQNFEDVILWRVLRNVDCGRYVDVGAFHPEVDSVTKWFYDQGWSGVNIEPVPESFALLKAARPRDRNLCAAAGAVAGVAELATYPLSPGLSSLVTHRLEAGIDLPQAILQVDVWPLHQILEPHADQVIHFLKIDTEGSEREVLLGMDFDRFRPWIVLIEATAPMTQDRNSGLWEEILSRNNYQHAYFDGLNDFYVAAEKNEIVAQLGVPPNVFDEFELAATVRETEANAELRTELSAKGDELGAMRKELSKTQNDLAAARNELATARDELVIARDEAARERSLLAELQTKYDEAGKQIGLQHSQLDSCDASIARLSGELAELAQALRASREREKSASERAAGAELQPQQVLNSRSFRWLAPARRARMILFPRR